MIQPLVYAAQVLVVVPQVTVSQLGHCVQVHTRQPLVVQSCVGEPEHALPPFAGDGAVQVLDCVPAVAPSLLEVVQPQVPQSDQPPSTRQPLVVQDRSGGPEHGLPPFSGGGVQVIDCVPAVALSAVEAVHSQALQTGMPSTGQPLLVQAPEPSDQVPAVALSCLFTVHSQVRCRLQVPLVLVQLPLLALQE